jgi:Uncharacterised nucleotidyltransferase
MTSSEPSDDAAVRSIAGPATGNRLWDAVDRLIDQASVDGVLVNKVGPLAAERRRRLGEPVPPALRYEERAALLNRPLAIQLMQRVRSNSDGPLLIFKGPVIASLYPSRLRRFSDVDLLSWDADGVARSLRNAGFEIAASEQEAPTLPGHHHLPALAWPTIPLGVELHSRFNLPDYARHPAVPEIFDAAATWDEDVEGVVVPHPAHHALILAAHSWQHEPLQTLRDLIDVAAVAALADERQLDQIAATWHLQRIWRTTKAAIDGLFYGGRRSLPLRVWARHLEEVRARTVLDDHLQRWLSSFWELSPPRAIRPAARAIGDDIRPLPGEKRREKLTRVVTAARDLSEPVTRRRNGAGTPE